MIWQDTLLTKGLNYSVFKTAPLTTITLKLPSANTLLDEAVEGYFYGAWLNLSGSLDCVNATINLQLTKQGIVQDLVATSLATLWSAGISGNSNFHASYKTYDDYNKNYTVEFFPPEPIPITSLYFGVTMPSPTIDPFLNTTANAQYEAMVVKYVKSALAKPSTAPSTLGNFPNPFQNPAARGQEYDLSL